MNYEIIKNEIELQKFIDILPDTTEEIRMYITLFSRKKYDSTGIIKSDRQQLKRVLAKKEHIIEKIRQMETAEGTYLYDGKPVPPESLALYITPNPRSLEKANFKMLQEISKNFGNKNFSFNPQSLAMNCVQTSCGVGRWFDIDLDQSVYFTDKKESLLPVIENILGKDNYKLIDTRGGYHILVELENELPKTWYRDIQSLPLVDIMMSGKDSLVPVCGAIQGNYVPKLV